jgi:ribonuclease BN (tRNA processing enzyme)
MRPVTFERIEPMKLRLLPSTFERDGSASARQHFSCLIIDGCVAVDAGSLASAVTSDEREQIRDVVLTHAHLDHIAGLPLFIDDLFPTLTEPVRVHATREVIEVLETHIFNWSVYPRFSELKNRFGDVIDYRQIVPETEFEVRHLKMRSIAVNHKVPACGFLINDERSSVAFTGDTAEMDRFWEVVNALEDLDALLIECAFPDEFDELSAISHHLTPSKLKRELGKFQRTNCPVFAINIKPSYRDAVCRQLSVLGIKDLQVLETGRQYSF